MSPDEILNELRRITLHCDLAAAALRRVGESVSHDELGVIEGDLDSARETLREIIDQLDD